MCLIITLSMCPHGVPMIHCDVCNAGPICIHSYIKSMCTICIHAERCEHNRRKMRCTFCLHKDLTRVKSTNVSSDTHQSCAGTRNLFQHTIPPEFSLPRIFHAGWIRDALCRVGTNKKH